MAADPRTLVAALFEAHFDAILAYARRRTLQLSDAEDVVAETFVVAWRRLDQLPRNDAEYLPWLYGIARRVLANQHRARLRRQRLLERLRSVPWWRASSPLADATDVTDALATLPVTDQEVLRLVAWEELSHAEAALVLGISANAVGIRLHRARRRLAAAMKGSGPMRTWTGRKGVASDAEPVEEV